MATEHLGRPSTPYTDSTLAAYTAEDAPFSANWIATQFRVVHHVKQALYGDGAFVGDVPHAHLGAEEAHPHPEIVHNIIETSLPVKRSYRERGGRWNIRGFVDVDDVNVLRGGVVGDYGTQLLYRETTGDETNIIGDGADMVFSLFARTDATTTVGFFYFGESIGSSSRVRKDVTTLSGQTGGAPGSVEDATAETRELRVAPGSSGFVPGNRVLVHAGDLSTNWKRFWFRATNVGAHPVSDSRLMFSVAQTFDATLELSGFMVYPGRRLHPFCISCAEYKGNATGTSNQDWDNMPPTVPVYDWTVSMDSAVELEGF